MNCLQQASEGNSSSLNPYTERETHIQTHTHIESVCCIPVCLLALVPPHLSPGSAGPCSVCWPAWRGSHRPVSTQMVSGDKSRSCRTQMEAGGCCSLKTREFVCQMLHQHLKGKTKSLKLNIQYNTPDQSLVCNCFNKKTKALVELLLFSK